MTAPYRDSTPRHDPAPRVRWRWRVRSSSDNLARDLGGGLIVTAMAVWSMFYIGLGFDRTTVRGAQVVAAFALMWALAFVTREPIK